MRTQIHETKRTSRPEIGLAAFFRKLEQKPDLLERFSAGRAGRAEVLRHFNLSAKHRQLLLEGSSTALAAELSGGNQRAENSTVINIPLFAAEPSPSSGKTHSATHIDCGHPDCEAFLAATRTI
jgi:hypothetical protein